MRSGWAIIPYHTVFSIHLTVYVDPLGWYGCEGKKYVGGFSGVRIAGLQLPLKRQKNNTVGATFITVGSGA